MEICVNYRGIEHWVSLPADVDEIAEMFGINLEEFDEPADFEEELLFTDFETDLDLTSARFKELGLGDLCELAECEEQFHDAAVAISEAYSINEVDWTTCRNVCVVKVDSNEELGEYLVENDYLGPIPEHLLKYLDYEKIGESYEYDGSWTSVGFLFDW